MMNISNEILGILKSHFDTSGWPEHVNPEKLRDRFSFEKADADQTYVAKIERHRPVLGVTYTKGLGMSAFQTYFMQYEVNLETREVKETPIKYLPVKSHDIDLEALVREALEWERFYLEVSSLDNGKFQIRETVSNHDAVVDSLDEAIAFARTLSDGFVEYFDETLEMELPEGYSPGQIREIMAEYAQLLDGVLAEKAREAWGRDIDDE